VAHPARLDGVVLAQPPMRYDMARTLANFTITESGDNYLLHIEDDAAETIELTATYDQLDLLVEAIDQHLDEDAKEIDEVEN
jgi:hypothetical protein